MRKVKLAMYVALDGVVENPSWTGPFWNDELAALQQDYLFASEALLLGRVTYEGFAAAWPMMTDTGDFGVKMNTMPKFVASRTLDQSAGNATVMPGDIVASVARLKEQPGGDLLIYGSGTLVGELTRHGLIDEYRLMVYSVIVGTGKRLFAGLSTESTTALHLEHTTTTSTGVVILTYATTLRRTPDPRQIIRGVKVSAVSGKVGRFGAGRRRGRVPDSRLVFDLWQIPAVFCPRVRRYRKRSALPLTDWPSQDRLWPLRSYALCR